MKKPLIRLLSDGEIRKIQSSSLEVLENIGITIESKKVRRMLADVGAKVNDKTGLVQLPGDLVDKFVRKAPHTVVYGARNPKYDLVLKPDGDTYTRPIGRTEGYIDLDTRRYRKARISDVKDWTRLVDALDNISFCACPYPDDILLDTRDIHTLSVMLENTEKHVENVPYSGKNMKYMIELAVAVTGGINQLKKRPILSILTSSFSPLQYNRYATDVIFQAGTYGIPIEINTMPSAGATGPITLAGMLLITHVELLTGIVLAQVTNPGTPVVYRPLPVVLDMLTGVGLQGTAENAMMAAAGVQLARECCNIPAHVFGQVTDALIPDGQSMIERVINTLLPALANATIVGGAGNIEHCYTADPVQLVIDDEISAMILRILRGFEVNDDTLGLDALARVKRSGDLLTNGHTLKYFKNEYFRPHILNRNVREIWEYQGSRTMNENARRRAKDILKRHEPSPLDQKLVTELRLIVRRAENN